MILVDYRCNTCMGVSEHRVANPVPATVTCPACGASARRQFAAVGLSGRAAPPVQPRTVRPNRALCQDNPDVPGLCHMTPDAARAWVARARRDNRTLDRELERQECALKENPGRVPEPVSHDHGHGESHDHSFDSGHSHGQSDGHATHPPTAAAGANTRSAR